MYNDKADLDFEDITSLTYLDKGDSSPNKIIGSDMMGSDDWLSRTQFEFTANQSQVLLHNIHLYFSYKRGDEA